MRPEGLEGWEVMWVQLDGPEEWLPRERSGVHIQLTACLINIIKDNYFSTMNI